MTQKWKRKCCLLLVLALVCSILPVNAMATSTNDEVQIESIGIKHVNPLYAGVVDAEELNTSAGVRPYATVQYHTTVEAVGEEVRADLVARTETIEFGYETDEYSEDIVVDLMYAFMDEAMKHTGVPTEGDYLQWQYAGWECNMSGQVSDGIYYLVFTYAVTYYTDAEQEAEMDRAVEELLEQLDTDGTDYVKVKAIYDWICDNVTYDYENLEDDSHKLKYTAYAAMMDGTAVCQGYALLLYRLALELGVDARLIAGDGSGDGITDHGWNIVELGNLYYNADSTWDADYGKNDNYHYFLLCEENFTGHTRDAAYATEEFYEEYPMSLTDYDPNAEPTVPPETEPEEPSEDEDRIQAPEVTISNVASSGKIRLEWDAVDGAEEYEVYRATSKDGTYKLLKTVTGTRLTNTSVTPGNKYYYYVVAVAEDGTKSAASGIVSRTCDCARPEITLSNVASSGKIKIKWDAVDGAEGYEVYRATSKSGTYKLLKTVTGTSLTNTSTTAGKTYYYKVKALGSTTNANSAFSEVKSRTCDCARPEITLSNAASSGKIKIKWDAVDGAESYEVYRATSKSGTYKLLKTVTGTSLTNTSTTAGKTYYYKVRALGSVDAAKSAYSEIKSRTCDLARPDVSITLNNSGKPKLTWDAVDGAVEYEVYRATSKSGTYKLMTTTTKTSYTNTGAEVSKTYYYRVKAIASKSAADSAKSAVDFINCSSVGISDSVLSKKVVTLINEYRADAGLPKLEWYEEGANAAKIRAAELTKSFSVDRPDGSDFGTLCEPYGLSAECLVSGASSAGELVDAMMDNYQMQDICLNEEFTYAVAAYNGKYWAVLFG